MSKRNSIYTQKLNLNSIKKSCDKEISTYNYKGKKGKYNSASKIWEEKKTDYRDLFKTMTIKNTTITDHSK